MGPLIITATELRVRAATGLRFTVCCAATGKAALKPALFNSRVADLSAMRLLARAVWYALLAAAVDPLTNAAMELLISAGIVRMISAAGGAAD